MSVSKKGISALQVMRQTGVSYQSALFLVHRIRFAMAPAKPEKQRKLVGTVECDETYVGGKPRKRSMQSLRMGGRPRKGRQGHGTDKMPVLAMVEGNGEIRVRCITKVTASNVQRHMCDNVDSSARIVTDECRPTLNPPGSNE